jgi:protein-ribulosamine 3-kinase
MSTTVDFQCMRASRNTIGQEFVTAYRHEVGASKPEEDFDDRNALYALLVCLALIQAAFQN